MERPSGTEEAKMKATSDVMLRTNDFTAAKTYYNAVLGFPVVIEKENLLGFDLGGFVLYFEHGEENGSVFEFEVPDVAEAKNHLLQQGCALIEENPTIPRCYLRDPYGLIFNLTQTFEG
jgi:catechol 2,3-dioxygenase-like lactoylglutathione lyase family enzyme